MAGSTGLVVGHLVDLLLAGAEERPVTALVRRPSGRSHPRLTELEVEDLARSLDDVDLAGADVFCCLGTTTKKAGAARPSGAS